jgi:predicted AAA+ superfamily ATPase
MKEKDWVSPKDTLVKHLENSVETAGGREACSQLLRFSGFPEPFVRGSNRFLRKWSRDYLSLILREDLVELTRIRELDTAEKVVLLLPDRVGSPLSISSIARDVESSYPTVLNHINQLKKLWLLTGVRPWHSKINRAVHKEEKVYFLNWTYAAQESATFENFIAIVLIRACLVWSDLGFGQAEVYYIRNRDGIEIDFLVALNRKPAFLVETKLSDANISRASKSIADLLGVPLVQLVKTDGICIHHTNGAWSLSASRFLEFMP